MKDETFVNHQPLVVLPKGNQPLVGPIYQSVKFSMPSFNDATRLLRGEGGGFFYSRVSNPTVRQLEDALAKLQGRTDAICFGSGVAALSVAFFSLLKAGDHVILFRESYKPTRQLLHLLAKFGVTSSLLGIKDHAEIERTLALGKTRLVVFESVTNPMLRVADIGVICAAAKKHGAETLLDNTFSGVHNHGDLPVDYFVHSLTKFVAGHGDVLGGVLIGDKRIRGMRGDSFHIGASLDPNAAFLILRGLKTYFVRFKQQSANALAIAECLAAHSKVKNLRYPGLPSDPDHELAKKQSKDFGAMIAFDLAGDSESLPRFIDRLKVFALAGSLGSTESLVAPARLFYSGDMSEAETHAAGMHETSVRLSIGIEAVEDLIADLQQGLAAV